MPTTVKLTNGEEVTVALESVCNTQQTFSRIGTHLLAGIVNMAPPEEWHGIYLWHEVGGVYRYVGDIVLREHQPQAVQIEVHAHIPLSDNLAEQHGQGGFSAEARRCLQESLDFLQHKTRMPHYAKLLARSDAAAT